MKLKEKDLTQTERQTNTTTQKENGSQRHQQKLIDWDAYQTVRKALNTTPQPTNPTETIKPTTETRPLRDAENLTRSAEAARIAAAGEAGRQLGATAGGGWVKATPTDLTKSALGEAMKRYDQELKQWQGETAKLYADGLKRQSAQDLQANREQQANNRTYNRAALQAATQTNTTTTGTANSSSKQQTQTEQTAEKYTDVRPKKSTPVKKKDAPHFVVAEKGDNNLSGQWTLNAQQAATIVQTALEQKGSPYAQLAANALGMNEAEATQPQKIQHRAQQLLTQSHAGNTNAQAEMEKLMQALVPALKGKGVVDGLLQSAYKSREK